MNSSQPTGEASIRAPKKVRRSLLPSKKPDSIQRLRSSIDWPFAVLVIILLSIGTTFVFSSSYVYAQAKYGDSYFFIRKQVGWVLLAVVVLYLVSVLGDYLFLKRFSIPIFLISYVLLWFVFFFGADANGAQRWIYIGPISVQPSEI